MLERCCLRVQSNSDGAALSSLLNVQAPVSCEKICIDFGGGRSLAASKGR